eukprot:TRINITY_DN3143_c0_g1_i2.p1 TRINITY_DN3143_c0_g1~~TRINITY_DN3143_c0_g1_i2.p1  ORF type:complete len:215 (-),score=72.55 TRINITY_DN3143_c0_g1_i2:295-939(-)
MSERRIPIQQKNQPIQFSFGFKSDTIPVLSPFIKPNELNSQSSNSYGGSNSSTGNNNSNGNNTSNNSSKKVNREEYLVHKVQGKKETLTGIALQYGVNVSQLKQLNGLWSNGEVFKKEIFIPIKINEMSEDQKQMVQRIQNRWNSEESNVGKNDNNRSKNRVKESLSRINSSTTTNGKEELPEQKLIQLDEEIHYDEETESHAFIFEARNSGGL